jgi:hypothetical protein
MKNFSILSGLKGTVNAAKYKTAKEGVIDLQGLGLYNDDINSINTDKGLKDEDKT